MTVFYFRTLDKEGDRFYQACCCPPSRPDAEFPSAHHAIATIGVHEVADPGGSGIAVVSPSGIVEQFIEKSSKPPANIAFAGILIGTPALLEAIPERRPADLGFDVLPKLAGRMAAYPIREFLLDIGTPHNYEKAQATWPGLAAADRAGQENAAAV